jgi:hypothetical protein
MADTSDRVVTHGHLDVFRCVEGQELADIM